MQGVKERFKIYSQKERDLKNADYDLRSVYGSLRNSRLWRRVSVKSDVSIEIQRRRQLKESRAAEGGSTV